MCDPKFTQGTVKHPDYFMVWCAFCFHGTGELVIIPRNATLNKELYLLCKNLPDCFNKCKSEIFVQDGAPAHKDKFVPRWIEFCGVNCVKDWPGTSPGFKPLR